MTIEHNHAVCDGCPGSPAIVTITEPWFEQWETVKMESGADAHLCPRCQQKRARGWLAEGLVLECFRCQRNDCFRPEEDRRVL